MISPHMSPSFFPLPPSSPIPSQLPPSNLNHTSNHDLNLTNNHKRKPDSPPPNTQPYVGPSSSSWPAPVHTDHPAKRQRPNLATNFSAMSLSQDQHNPQYSSSYETQSKADSLDHSLIGMRTDFQQPPSPFLSTDKSDYDDDGLGAPTRPQLDSDVEVEQLPDTSVKRPWHQGMSGDSDDEDEDEDEFSHAHLRHLPRGSRARRFAEAAQYPDTVEFPPDNEKVDEAGASIGSGVIGSQGPGLLQVDLLDSTPLKRKHRDEGPVNKRRREWGEEMDFDMDVEGIEEIQRLPPHVASGPGWYEPEKDRIVVTSISSPPSMARSRSSSPTEIGEYDYLTNAKLSQPGNQGFTISPSLLTHIMNAQRDFLGTPRANGSGGMGGAGAGGSVERGLVLYRPLGITADGAGMKGQGDATSGEIDWNNIEDSGRFEELDDDVDQEMQVESYGPGGGSPWMEDQGLEDDAMDLG